jgi:hypothetical protein
MEDITLPSNIIQKLDKMHRNMVVDGSWLITNEKDTKIVALTSAMQEVKKKYGELAKKDSFDSGAKGGSSSKKGGASSASGKQQTKTRCLKWQVTKKGNTIDHRGYKYVWCPKHTSKDGSINGLYMPLPHDHDPWAKAKVDKTAAFKKRKKEAKKSGGKSKLAKKSKPNGEALKLVLGKKMTTALVTQHHMSQTKAETLFDSVYKETMEDAEGN